MTKLKEINNDKKRMRCLQFIASASEPNCGQGEL